MERVAAQKGIIFLFFEATGSIWTFFIARAHVARDWFSFSLGFGAFECDDFLWHGLYDSGVLL